MQTAPSVARAPYSACAPDGSPAAQVVKLEGVSAGSGTPTAAQNGMPAFTPMKQEESKPEVKQGTPQGTPAQMDAGKYMYATKVIPVCSLASLVVAGISRVRDSCRRAIQALCDACRLPGTSWHLQICHHLRYLTARR